MRKLLVVTMVPRVGDYYRSELRDFFGEHLSIDSMVSSDERLTRIREYDMVLISTHALIENVRKHVRENARILKIVKNLNPMGVGCLDEIPFGSEALVVNVGPKTVSESIFLIYSYGRTDLELHPYYPGIKKYQELNYIITPGETDIVPECGSNTKVFDILNTTIDTRTFLEIISFFDLDKRTYLKKLLNRSGLPKAEPGGMSLVIGERFMLENVINALFENLNEGVLIYDEKGVVTSCSESTSDLLNSLSENIVGRRLSEIIPVKDSAVFGSALVEMIVKINRTALICSITPRVNLGASDYGIVLLNRYSDEEMKIYRLGKELIDQGHIAKYRRENIIGSSAPMVRLKAIATRMAKSGSNVLITGESGTGKELFAHVIHNRSARARAQFVAVNCSAIPENLLESELFGYDEGAFTGARKGGKPGLFEAANGGTLFLDEIGGMPLHLQNRLLRVLQEKQIMRVGSSRIINIDVRIIAATNIDLKRRMESGTFRKDLFYRLSVLPIAIPPLRERGNDVIEIFRALAARSNITLTLSRDVQEYFLRYQWEGNIRELHNSVEYFMNLDKSVIEMDDLPEYMRPQGTPEPSPAEHREFGLDDTILSIIHRRSARRIPTGRKTLSAELEKRGVFIGEQAARNELIRMSRAGLVEIRRGRGGTRLTVLGKQRLGRSEAVMSNL